LEITSERYLQQSALATGANSWSYNRKLTYRPAAIFVASRAGEGYDVSKSAILVGYATTLRNTSKASVGLVVFDLEKAIRVC
jgi:hypothetical protein